MKIVIRTEIKASLDEVWRACADLGSHIEWMQDAIAIRFLTEQQSGMDTRFECDTKIGPLKTTDEMHVTRWEDRVAIGIEHKGIVTGEGLFRFDERGAHVVVTWSERLHFPFAFGGPLGEVVAAPIMRLIWTKNLANLRRKLEEPGEAA